MKTEGQEDEKESMTAATTAAAADLLRLGPAGDEWVYDRATKTYDLTRSSSRSGVKTEGASAGKDGGGGQYYTVPTSRGPGGTSVRVDPAKTALVVVDMQNYFLDGRLRDHAAGLAAVAATLDVVARCRKVGIQIIWLNWGLTDADLAAMPASVSRSFSRTLIDPAHRPRRLGLGADLGNGMGRTLVAGEWNAALYPPLAAAVGSLDKHLDKDRMSGLWNQQTPLWRYLVQSGHRTLLFAGVNTDQCVLGTLSDAYNAGWDCIMVEDCCATTTEGAHDVCIHNVTVSLFNHLLLRQ
ncbi:hypothetical protein KJ359_006392 [Pestalotiopsis sp. 9143b]|nr:hypothetical protein KJ359_006392 [Pestalotiopsis sp. 9143b]